MITREDLPAEICYQTNTLSNGASEAVDDDTPLLMAEAVDRFKRKLIRKTLGKMGGNQSETAKTLGMRSSNLSRIMKQLGLR